jgi:hypothetical protein
MRNIGETLLLVFAVLAAAVLGVSYFFDGLPSWKIALVFVGFVLVTIGSIALSLRFFAATLSARTPRHYEQPIEGDYRELGDYRPPRPELPAPHVINVPRFTVNGSAQPFNMPQHQAPVLQTTIDDDAGINESLTVPLNIAMRFAGLPTPSRAEWTGKRENYSDASKFFNSHGMLDKTSAGGWKWKQEYPLESRKQWLLQFDDVHAHDRRALPHQDGG